MKFNFIDIDTFIDDYVSDTGNENINNELINIKKWVHDELGKLNYASDALRIQVSLMDIRDYKVKKPSDFKKIISVFGRERIDRKVKRAKIVEWVQENYNGCDLKISLECPKCHQVECRCDSQTITVDIDDIWRRANPEFVYASNKFFKSAHGLRKSAIPSSTLDDSFTLMKPSFNMMFGADEHIKGCLNLNTRFNPNGVKEYTIENNMIRFNFREGQMLFSYYAEVLGNDGYRMIPDFQEMRDFLIAHIESKIHYKEWRRSKRQLDFSYYQQIKFDRDRKMETVREMLDLPEADEWFEFIDRYHESGLPYDTWRENLDASLPDEYDLRMQKYVNRK